MADPWVEEDICMGYAKEVWTLIMGRSGFDIEVDGDTQQEILNSIGAVFERSREHANG